MWLDWSFAALLHWLGAWRHGSWMPSWLECLPSLHLLRTRCSLELILHFGATLFRLVSKLLLELVHVNLLGHVGMWGLLLGVAGNGVARRGLHELALLFGVPVAMVVMVAPLFC